MFFIEQLKKSKTLKFCFLLFKFQKLFFENNFSKWSAKQLSNSFFVYKTKEQKNIFKNSSK